MDSSSAVQAHCSFCRKGQEQVNVLIAGLGVYICNECVALAHRHAAEIGEVKRKVAFDADAHFRNFDDDRLLAFTARIDPLVGEIAAQQRLFVSILRERGVPWGRIGAALGVSRQAVWRRFGGADQGRNSPVANQGAQSGPSSANTARS